MISLLLPGLFGPTKMHKLSPHSAPQVPLVGLVVGWVDGPPDAADSQISANVFLYSFFLSPSGS